ncbi:hypothetical protein [Anaerobranca gottschalkii]|uniref:Uncharacterized protein n=1 Tax=Anaerobranca gottschalkii DSM 13577 TaxID=1120990 RepID=A0A1I0AJ71_9FIRM|nr:hypothetical protein [Anaerobranca gottschalkii]SES94227.1 hypothetical protein SAMN03080614_102226 [Anaerobranca gottschalkii DSM 13577]
MEALLREILMEVKSVKSKVEDLDLRMGALEQEVLEEKEVNRENESQSC